LYVRIAERAPRWTTNGNIGLVVGATAPAQLARVRVAAPDVPILLPGVGAQGGDLEASIGAGLDRTGAGLLVVAARQVMYASSGRDFAAAARAAASRLREQIESARANVERGR
jgi:orotidine-5'-phosphate decarboxylase